MMACDRNGIRFLLHFATDCPAGRPDVLVLVASILSTAPLPVRDVVLQAAVPKVTAPAARLTCAAVCRLIHVDIGERVKIRIFKCY